jgi:hypothetical protein
MGLARAVAAALLCGLALASAASAGRWLLVGVDDDSHSNDELNAYA